MVKRLKLYLKKISDLTFSLPTETDAIYWHPIEDVKMILPPPSLIGTGSRVKLVFQEDM